MAKERRAKMGRWIGFGWLDRGLPLAFAEHGLIGPVVRKRQIGAWPGTILGRVGSGG
jgi:hypothetical protein